jgi:Gas vesicle synthesis protein GvpL/GvpF
MISTMENNLIYVYCMSMTPIGANRDMEYPELKTIVFNDFHIFVKYVNENDFSEDNLKKHLSDLEWLETNARDHIRIIGMIMESNDVIPFKFGTIFNTTAGLHKFIADYNESLIENFHYIKGKEEWSVKVYCDRNELSEQIDELSQEAAALELQIMSSAPGKAFLLRRKKNDLIDNEMDKLCKKYGQEYYDALSSLSCTTYLNNLLPKEYTGRECTMILNATFLINKQKVSEFISMIKLLQDKVKHSVFILEESGPWPPFSFISIKEKPNVR